MGEAGRETDIKRYTEIKTVTEKEKDEEGRKGGSQIRMQLYIITMSSAILVNSESSFFS